MRSTQGHQPKKMTRQQVAPRDRLRCRHAHPQRFRGEPFSREAREFPALQQTARCSCQVTSPVN